MNKFSLRGKTILTIVLAAFVVAAGFAGGSWGIGHAEETTPTVPTIPTIPTVPTVPVVDTILPSTIKVNSSDTVFTISGSDFVEKEVTLIKWVGPDSLLHEATPDSVSVDGTTITITLPASLFKTTGDASVWVINYPGTDVEEQEGPLTVTIEDYYIYLPLILR
jgi:hypothetical protein